MKVGIIMGSTSDYEVMSGAEEMLKALEIPFEKKVVSAHRTPDLMYDYAKTAKARGISVIIAGAGGAAHLPGMVAAMTTLPVIGVPVKSRALNGLDSLLSIVQMPWWSPCSDRSDKRGQECCTHSGIHPCTPERGHCTETREVPTRPDGFCTQS